MCHLKLFAVTSICQTLAPVLIPSGFRQDLAHHKTRVLDALIVILRLAALAKHRLVTDRWIDRRIDTGPQDIPRGELLLDIGHMIFVAPHSVEYGSALDSQTCGIDERVCGEVGKSDHH